MAQIIHWGDDNITFEEGPFVACQLNGYRVECRVAMSTKAALPDLSIYDLVEKELNSHPRVMGWGWEEVLQTVDWLNKQVLWGRIVFDPRFAQLWIVKPVCHCPCHS